MRVISLQCPSVTYAQKGRRILANAGVRSRITRRTDAGCSYGLICSAAETERVLRLLAEGGVPCTLLPGEGAR